MRYLTSPLVFPIMSEPIPDGVIVVDNKGNIQDMLDPKKDSISTSIPIEKFDGFLCPGFVNAHCHLELSHLKGKISQKKLLPQFIEEMVKFRSEDSAIIEEAMEISDKEMYNEGIVAVGDISNTNNSIHRKVNSKLFYHTFIELFDIVPERAQSVFEKGITLQREYKEAGLVSTLVPHSPYTVTDKLMNLINIQAIKGSDILCIHNQETESENEMFEKGTGKLLIKLGEINESYFKWKATGKTSLASYLDKFHSGLTIQLVHNTFTSSSDLRNAQKNHENLFWCICANANLFIEDAMPDLTMLQKHNAKMTIGTDSYASNLSLSVLDELKTISTAYPEITLEFLLKAATYNGACFLKCDSVFGSLEKGKCPGIINISDVDLKTLKLRPESKVRRIV